MEKKLTKRDMFNMIKEVATELERNDIIEFCENELNLLDKKRNSSKKINEEKLALDKGNSERILQVLQNLENGATVDEIRKADNVLLELSNQKVTYLLTELLKDKKVFRSEKGRKKLYKATEFED